MGPLENGNVKFDNRIFQKKARERKDTEKMLQEQLNHLLAQSEHCDRNEWYGVIYFQALFLF